MRTFAIFLTLCAATSGQSMLESGAMIAGTTIGSAAGKKVSDGINANLRKTSKILEKAAVPQPKQSTPLLQVSAGVPSAQRRPVVELNNVPPPPPRRAPARKPAKPQTVTMPMVMSAVTPEGPPAMQVNVDISAIHDGMDRDSVLALGIPSARITMYQDGHVMEIYQYRNVARASGTVRLRDGAVWAIEARP